MSTRIVSSPPPASPKKRARSNEEEEQKTCCQTTESGSPLQVLATVSSSSTKDDEDINDEDEEDDAETVEDKEVHLEEDFSPGPIYRLRCTFGDPEKPLPRWTEKARKAVLVYALHRRNVTDTKGTKSVLLERLRCDVPGCVLEVDGHECLQRLVVSVLHWFGFLDLVGRNPKDEFQMVVPRRGSLPCGEIPQWHTILGPEHMLRNNSDKPTDTRLVHYVQEYGTNLDEWPQNSWYTDHVRNNILQDGKFTLKDLFRATFFPQHLKPARKLRGFVWDANAACPSYYGGPLSWTVTPNKPEYHGKLLLEQLAVRPGDEIHLHQGLAHFKLTVVRISATSDEESCAVPLQHLRYGQCARVRLLERKGPAIPDDRDYWW